MFFLQCRPILASTSLPQANIPQQSYQLQLWQAFNFSPIGNSTPFIEYFTVRNSICTESCKFPNQPKPKSAFKAFYLHNINNSLGKWSFINWSLLKLQYFAAFLPLLNTGWVSVWPYGICQNFPQVLIHLLDPVPPSAPQPCLTSMHRTHNVSWLSPNILELCVDILARPYIVQNHLISILPHNFTKEVCEF